MSKKGGDFEIIAIDFLAKIFKELKFAVVRERIQLSGSQDGYDNLIEIVDNKYNSRYIYSECKDYTVGLNYVDALIKLPQIATTHEKIDLVLFISPKRDFSNIFEETRNKPFLESIANKNIRVAFLTPETDIKKYFTLYPDIYKKVYLTAPQNLLEEERKEILEQFDKFIFSSKNLNKIVVDENDREKFIGKIQKNNFHIQRTVRNSQNKENTFFNDFEESTLLSIIEKNRAGLVLLGNPGYGKTSELKQLAAVLWENRTSQDLIPIFYTLKNFSSASKVEDILPENYKFIYNLIIILDGIDEIQNIIDFSNKLQNFIVENNENILEKKLKFVISCRTNIYKKYIKSINDFEVYFLEEIQTKSSVKFLLEKFDLDLRESKTFDFYKNREILENPFYLNLMGSYYRNHATILTNKAVLINEFVNSRLEEDKESKFKNDVNFDKDKIISYTQKIAFSLEAMQKPHFLSNEIKRITHIEETDLAKNPFLEESLTDNWSFVYKNLQEYFVASILTSLDFEQIIGFIKIDTETDKIHPTWHNVITFLLNLNIDEAKHFALVDWLMKNDAELLFNADTDRISENIKTVVLKDFFNKTCIENTLWINDAQKIAAFSDCEPNIEYLISKIKDANIHRRARMSGIKLLSYMSISPKYYMEIKNFIIDIINENNYDNENYLYLKQDAIMLTESIRLNQDTDFFNQIIYLLRDRDNREIVSSIIHSVPDKSIEDNIDYFLEILEKSVGDKSWKTTTRYNSITSTKENIFNLFKRINNPEILIKIYSFLVERHKNYKIKENLIEEFLTYLKKFFESKNEFHQSLIEIISNAVINDKIRYVKDDLLIDIVKTCKIENQVFTLVLNSIIGNSDRMHFLAEITIEDYFFEILKRYNNKILNDEFVEQFRNVLSHKNRELSKKFENFIEFQTPYVFKEKWTEKDIEQRNNYWATKDQNNFDVLFDNEKIVNQIIKIYTFLEKEELSYSDMDKFYHKFYENFSLQKEVTENAKHLLYEILRDNYPNEKKLSLNDLPKAVEDSKFNIMLDIMNSLPEEKKGKKINISIEQTEYIKNWCIENTEIAKKYYTNHLSIRESWNNDIYQLFNAIYKFQKFFKFNLDETLLLDMIWCTTVEQVIDTTYMDGIVSQEKINERILANLKNKKLTPTIYCNHLKYCLENNVDYKSLNLDLKSKIYEFINGDYYYYGTELLENFFGNDIEVLTEFLNYNIPQIVERKKSILDNIILILQKNNQNEVIEDFLNSNYIKLISENTYQEVEIIRKLVSLNSEGIFDQFYNLIKRRIKNSTKGEVEFRDYDWQKYTRKSALDKLIELLEICLLTPNIDELFGKFYHPIRIASETVINICKTNDETTCTDTISKLNKLDLEKIKATGGDLFYFFKLKNDVQEIYYNHKSKPYNFIETLKILEENKYLFIN
jgi:hypothetical protein